MNFVNKYLRNLAPYKVASHKVWEVDDNERRQILKLDWNEATLSPSPKVKEALKNRHQNLKIENLEVNDLKNDRDKAEINYNIAFKAVDFSKKLGNDLFFRVMPFYGNYTFTSAEERMLPFETAFPYQDDYEVEFEIPAGYKYSELPKDENIMSEFGKYSITFKNENGKLIVHRVLTINKGVYSKEKFSSYLDFRKKTSSLDNTKVLITKL